MEHSGYYVCYTDNEKSHYLYLKARVCENCMEVDLTAVVVIVIVDICITLGLLVLVYYWSKNKKAKAKPVKRGTGAGGRPRGQNKERPPPVPNPDYERSLSLQRGGQNVKELCPPTSDRPLLTLCTQKPPVDQKAIYVYGHNNNKKKAIFDQEPSTYWAHPALALWLQLLLIVPVKCHF
ncbi:T-cell surface glycoprotein CD3 epsilon chain [Fukomys damarensis]|uniref:T-cell surface glycoprotein CD3 epsilon chain n=1 Tax=Fukomys damarensis TaxID=885580 RepID=A0A091DLC2_FUKDA|nr:T-cell surface glycoprotein CD3 epsilon chain [Fukomys damarensis]